MRAIIIAVAMACPSTAIAQPYSQSMVQCAALYQNAAQWVPSDDLAAQLMDVAHIWADASLDQSALEGKNITLDEVWVTVDAQTTVWEAEGAMFVFSEEFRDWTAYCKAFAKDRGIATS